MNSDSSWYAVYTSPRAEKQVSIKLAQQGIEHYLPIQRVLKKWSDRKKWVEEPLFRSYLFVCVSDGDYYKVLNTYGVVRFITFEGKAVKVPEQQIEMVKRLLMQADDFEVSETLESGTPVEIVAGPLIGTIGEVIRYKGENRVAVRIDSIERSIILNIPDKYCEKLTDSDKLKLYESTYKVKFV